MKKPSKFRWFLYGLGVLLLCAVLATGWVSVKIRPGVPIASMAPAVSFQDGAGNSLLLSPFRGKVVLLDFWQST